MEAKRSAATPAPTASPARRNARRVLALSAVLGCALLLGGSYTPSTPTTRAASATSVPATETCHANDEPLPPPATDEGRYFPFLPGEDTSASISVGDTSHGYLIGGAALTENDAVGILPMQRERDLRYGARAVIEMIQSAGQALYKETKTRLWVGNIGKKEGGDISWSVSHNSGRDADIAFCYMNRKGEPKDPPDLVPLNGQGLAKGQDLRLDPKRTWLVIKALVSYPKAQVQYLFMADALKTQVLMHASGMGESPELIQRAAAIVRQPYGSAPHNDHLHLRIFCDEHDIVGGCVNTGAVHPWTKLYDDERTRFVKRTAALLDSPASDRKRRAIERLTLLDARDAADKITSMLIGESGTTDVRQAAARSLARLGGPAQVPALTAHYRHEDDALVRIAITQSIGAIGGRDAGLFLAHAVGVPHQEPGDVITAMSAAVELGGPTFFSVLPQAVDLSRATLFTEVLGGAPPPSENEADALIAQLVAIEAAALSERLEPMPRLIALLNDPRPLVRDRAAHALRMITNLTYYIPWKTDDPHVLAKGRSRWRKAYQQSRGAPRDAWLATGFLASGFKVRELNQRRAWELVRAIASGSDHISYNAQRVLMRLTQHRPPSTTWSKAAACMHWFKWIKAKRETYQLEKPPAKVFSACAGS